MQNFCFIIFKQCCQHTEHFTDCEKEHMSLTPTPPKLYYYRKSTFNCRVETSHWLPGRRDLCWHFDVNTLLWGHSDSFSCSSPLYHQGRLNPQTDFRSLSPWTLQWFHFGGHPQRCHDAALRLWIPRLVTVVLISESESEKVLTGNVNSLNFLLMSRSNLIGSNSGILILVIHTQREFVCYWILLTTVGPRDTKMSWLFLSIFNKSGYSFVFKKAETDRVDQQDESNIYCLPKMHLNILQINR